MELSLTSNHKDNYPVCGFFIEDARLTGWMSTLFKLELDPLRVEIHVLPSHTANEIWGCLVLVNSSNLPSNLGKHQTAHMLGGQLIIPEKSKVLPELTAYDFERLFLADTYVFHPDFGLFKLVEPISLEAHINFGELLMLDSSRPKDYKNISGEIMALMVSCLIPSSK